MVRAIAFDVNETLLDLAVLRPTFERVFGDAAVTREWFSQLLQSAMTLALTGNHYDFTEAGAAALDVVAARHGVALTEEGRAEIRSTMTSLPPHLDVAEGLARLKNAGFRMAALTNSPQAAAESQLANAGVADYFERMLSVDAVQRFKPASEVYQMAAAELGLEPADLWMVAAHDWDIAGAMAAGLKGALVTRPGVVVNPLYPDPDVVGPDLVDVAERIIAWEA